MNKKDSKEESILKIKKKQNFFLILSKLVSENFCTVFFVFVILQIIEIIQMIYFTYSYAIIGAPKDEEVLLQNIQNVLKNSHFTVIYRGADGSFISYGFITFQNVFMIFTVYTSMFTIFAIATVLMEKYYAEKMKKLINRLSAILSLVFYFNFFILSFPVYQLYFIPLECLISPSSPFYMGDPYYCFDSVHLTFLVISVFSLVIWILFNLVFSLFVNEYFPESRIPWSGQVTKNNFILFLWKLAASIFIFFAKANINRIFIIGIIVVNLVNIIIRYKTPFMFKSGVHFFYSVRECIIFILTILNYLNYIFDITFTFPILLLSMFFTFSFVFTFFRLNDREIKKIQLKDVIDL
jgi:hypothetical protein